MTAKQSEAEITMTAKQSEAEITMASTTPSKHDSWDISGSVYLVTSAGNVLSLPIPAKSPRDPLNWGKKKRTGAYFALAFFSVTVLVITQGAGLLNKPLGIEFTAQDMAPFNLGTLAAAPTLFMGLSAFLWIPLSLATGRRPVFILSTIVLLVAIMWAGFAGSFYQLLAAICLMGLAGGSATSLVLLIVIDMTFIHQRPHAIAFIWSIVGGLIPFIVLAMVPQMITSLTNWRLLYLFWAIPGGISVLLAVLFFPETYFLRPAVAFDGRVFGQSATEKLQVYEGWDEVPGGKALPDAPEISSRMSGLKVWGKTRGGWKAMMACYPQILLCFCNPLIFWVALLNAIVLGGVMSISETFVVLLSSEPYALPMHTIGLVRISGAVGSVLAWPASGIMVTSISRRLAMRNSGVRDAEHYLPAFALPILTSVISVILYGLTAKYQWHWIWVYVAAAFNSFGFGALSTANTLWVTEAFPRWAAPALVVVGGWSYVASFGTSYLILPWIKSQGYLKTNIEIGILILAIGGIAVPVSFWGKGLRQFIHGKWSMSEAGALRPQ